MPARAISGMSAKFITVCVLALIGFTAQAQTISTTLNGGTAARFRWQLRTEH
jgi:hypothetical protein